MMWPKAVDWKDLKFGVEIEFVGGDPAGLELLPDWVMSLDEQQLDETGAASGSELKPPPICWEDRGQICTMLERLQAQGATANWSCGLHVHVGLEPWGADMLLPLIDAALLHQQALQALLASSEHRLLYCPPVLPEMREQFIKQPDGTVLRHRGRPQSHRCGVNIAAWFDFGTVEIRYANGSLHDVEVLHTIELCLRYVAAIGQGLTLTPSSDPYQLAVELGAPVTGYPPHIPIPAWFQQQIWLEAALIPLLAPMAEELVQDGEIHHIATGPDGFLVAIKQPGGMMRSYRVEPPDSGWKVIRELNDL
ncbi:amidoligase family protein [Paenibacillus agricola]|uniref:Amidoligase enzyme n=1 Tax=Paenibacillus agricola TaxID=2716264 RepID=A0ABX0J9C4_9BACL|nr:amidoligase family protein [Paenibacillus agricola]NHN33020.1 hypothetical protein [Paenibacillus agricola]